MNAGLTYPCGPALETSETREIASGVVWIRLPMPFALDHANVWAIRDDDATNSWMIVDTGLKTLETVGAWRSILAGSGPLGGAAISRVLVTHMHADHLGLAGWMTRKFGCRLWMPELEYLNGRISTSDSGRETPEDLARFYHAAGWTDEELDGYRTQFGMYGDMTYQLPDSYRRLQEGELVRIGGREWRVMIGRGHSPEHASLYCLDLGLLLSGDQVLPKISTNVSVHAVEPDADPLADWLSSIKKLRREVSDNVLVLPGHNEPFRGLHDRLDQLENGHSRALERLLDHLREPKRVVDTFGVLFARMITSEPILLGLATGESLAHVNHLLRLNEVVVERNSDGVDWYVRAGSQHRPAGATAC